MDVNSTKSVTQYKCRFCKKCYKRRNYFQNHTLICEEIHKSKYAKECEEEVKQDIPTMQDMYYLLQTFIKKNVELEAKVDELSRYIEKTKKRINIIEWLNENIQLEEVNVLDRIDTLEHAEVGYRVDLSCQTFRVQNESVKQLGIMPRLQDILVSGEITAEVVDRQTNTILLLMTGVKLESRQTTVDARGLMTETWNFRGKIAQDEAN